jgi:creatinine amidohydrolase/Fe(II)-dependent formamide hydrolase-like protein
MITRDSGTFTCVDTGETSDIDVGGLIETPNDAHAGEIETSTSLAMRSHLVQMENAEAFIPDFSSRYLDFSSSRSVEWYARTEKISSSGVLGDPTKATVEKGEEIWRIMIAHLTRFVTELRDLTFEEIYERRY